MSVAFIKTYAEPPFREREILRYAGCKSADEELLSLLRDCAKEVRDKLVYKVCYREFPLSVTGNVCGFDAFSLRSENLAKNLEGCDRALVFAATVGMEIDRLIGKYGRLSPSKALFMQAIGAERIEALCDLFCEEFEKENEVSLKPRFSPGYGDLALQTQKEIFAVLDCSKKIGVCLSESLLISPSKSVTGFVGILRNGHTMYETNENRCRTCTQKDCAFGRKI